MKLVQKDRLFCLGKSKEEIKMPVFRVENNIKVMFTGREGIDYGKEQLRI